LTIPRAIRSRVAATLRGCVATVAVLVGCVSAASAQAAGGRVVGDRGEGREFARIVESVRVATGMPAMAAAVVMRNAILARAVVEG
jgi:hypothetical protein